MSPLFYQLIYHEKTARWWYILDCLEELTLFTAHELAVDLHCTERTIGSDIKQMKKYFGSAIVLFGDEEGYHFSLKVPIRYIQKKQALLDNEPLFFLIDQLVGGHCRTNQQWADQLSVSIASFGRIKKTLLKLLNSRYQLTLVSRKNQLQGNEPSIRQLMYDFYFESPFLPRRMEKKHKYSLSDRQLNISGQWQLDPLRLQQWAHIASWRIEQGHSLSPKSDQEQERKLAEALNESIELSFPSEEKAVLFLLALKEEQFLNPLKQKEFIQQFSCIEGMNYSMRDFDQMTAHFFELMVTLISQFFQLPTNQTSNENVSETKFLIQLIDRYLDHKKYLEKSLVLHFKLSGSPALQEWIQKRVQHHLKDLGYYLMERSKMIPYTRQITITNKLIESSSSDIILPTVPEEEEIVKAIKQKAVW